MTDREILGEARTLERYKVIPGERGGGHGFTSRIVIQIVFVCVSKEFVLIINRIAILFFRFKNYRSILWIESKQQSIKT